MNKVALYEHRDGSLGAYNILILYPDGIVERLNPYSFKWYKSALFGEDIKGFEDLTLIAEWEL